MTAAERLRDMARVLGDTEWGASLADELRDVADEAEREARRGENPNSKLRRQRMQAHIEEVQRICAERRDRIKELNVQLVEARALVAEYERTIGIGADGKRIGRFDEVWTVDGDGPYHVDCNWADGTASLVEVTGRVECRTLTHERPAPKVLDADGAEIRVGDAMRSANGVDLTVTKVMESTFRPGDWTVVGTTGRHGVTSFFASDLTHRATAIAGDGRPLRVGETVWGLDASGPYTVAGFDGGTPFVLLDGPDGEACALEPDALTHEQPDELRRLVRRAKALAGKGAE